MVAVLSEATAVTSVSFILQLATAIAAGATGLTAFKGYRATASPTLLRLFASFSFLAMGFLLGGLSSTVSDPALSEGVLILGSALDVVGYFLLALSHFFTVRGQVTSVGTLLFLPVVSIPSLVSLELFVNAASLYLLLYISVETLIYFFQNRSGQTLISISGLLLITSGVLLQMLTAPAAYWSLIFSGLRLAGFLILFSPVAILFRRRSVVSTT